MQTIVLARHCKTDWNAEGRVQGQTDRPLNPDGLTQAQELACAMRDDPHLRIQIIVTSDLKRAVQTATIIAEVLHIPMQDVRLDSRLRECSFGNLEGSTFFELKHRLKEDARASNSEYDLTEHGGESSCQVTTRQVAALRDHCPSLAPSSHLLVIGHGRSLGTLLHHFQHKHPLIQGRYQLLTISL
ncbi:hypothetical protein A3E39_04330 [Candidatus Uhrbacteria bacterium RIFCSPHIGHO2_12_FULL_60_25]|uniref:Phosphoglycerate mutase n=1 Tax=Candidatus Uhrbacteria bacterium RIFCSPHIGHO2_12_FULL_60_25 TaxID=1802399 RepID=A0A1F7UIK1_9BACT|nr:MAG: hypothetical protein A3E39_04330 [Candidatus Uhrbacteria bacterium RIFCSPHIGHO2_12_FULL_60_25]